MPSNLKATDPRAFLNATPAQTKLIDISGCDDHGEGLTAVVQLMLLALTLLHALLQLPNTQEWVCECRSLLKKCEDAEEEEHFHLASDDESPGTSKVFKMLLRPPESQLPQAAADWSLLALGWLITASASAGAPLHFDVIDAWSTLRRGRASGDEAWRVVSMSGPTDQKTVEALLEGNVPARLRVFLGAFLAALQSPLDLPSHDDIDTLSEELTQGDPAQGGSGPSPDDQEDDPSELQGDAEEGEAKDGDEAKPGTSSTKWLAGQANFAPYVARFGLIGARDRLHPKELRQVTRSLKGDFLSGPDSRRDQVAFSHVSLKSSTPSRITLNVSLLPGIYPRLNVPAGEMEWCIRHAQNPAAADSDQSDELRSEVEVIRIVLDEDIADRLRQLYLERPDAASVRELFGISGDPDEQRKWLREYRAYLRSHSDPMHPAYDARFARSEGDTYREIGAPDIVAALLAQDFQGCPMSLLHYATFPRAYLRKFNRAVNQYLGCRTSEEPDLQGDVGASTFISPEDYVQGWSRLQERAAHALRDLRAAQSATDLVDAFNRLETARLTTFITCTGHRATKLSRLTINALFSHSKYLSIYDKDVGDYLSHRIIPAHRVADQLLGCLAGDLELLERRAAKLGLSLATEGRRAIRVFDQDSVAFFHIKLDSDQPGQLLRAPIRTREVTKCSLETLGRAANIGRHFLVSQLFMRGSSAWIVRVLTGHARTHAECFSDGMAIPPSFAIEQLESALNKLFESLSLAPIPGSRKNGSRPLASQGAALPPILTDPYLNPKISASLRVLPAPFDAYTLTALRVAEEGRRTVTDAALKLSAGARVVAHFLLIDLLDPVDQAILFEDLENSIVLLGSVPWALWKRQNCANEICQPLTAPTVVALRTLNISNPGDWRRHASEVGRWAKETFASSEWPQDDLDAYYSLASLALRLRRFRCSPSLLAAQSRAVPSATYSRRSLRRLDPGWKQELGDTNIGSVIRNGPARRRTARDGALGELCEALSEAGKTTIQSGEERARARSLIRAIKGIDTSGDEHAKAFKTVLVQEALNWIKVSNDRDQFSTLSGYADEVMIALSCIPRHDHPGYLDAVEIEEWVEAAKEAIDSEKSKTAEVQRGKTRYFGLKRFIRMGKKVGWAVPGHLFSDDGPRVVFDGMRRSASSALLLSSDFPAMRQLLSAHFADWPILQGRALLANNVLEHAPLRSMEQIVLRKNCVVSAIDSLSIASDGFSHLKSRNAFRLIELPPDVNNALKATMEGVDETASRYLFLDDSCADWRMAREIDQAQVAAACCVTGDARMRKHSFRASAACRIAWPNWEEVGRAACHGDWTPVDHEAYWRRDFHRGFPSLIRAVRATGHGHHLTTLVHYCPAWPLLLASQIAATLVDIPATNELIEECFKTTDSTRRAKSRVTAAGRQFDAWNHLAERALKALPLKPLLPNELPAVIAPTAASAAEPAVKQIVLFGAHTILGASASPCADDHHVPISLGRRILAAMPDGDGIRDIVRRLRGDPSASVLARDRRYLGKEKGKDLTAALLAIRPDQAALLLHDLSPAKRDPKVVPPAGDHFVARIESHLVCLPTWAGIQIRFSECHPLPVSPEALQHLRPRISIGPTNDRIGAQPMLQVFVAQEPENATVMGRLTALTRVLLESLSIVQKFIQGDKS